MSRHLMIATYWIDTDAAGAADALAHQLEPLSKVPDTGGLVAIEEGNVDRALRAMLRSLNLRESADG